MSEHKITVPGGTSKRLLTAGKYCDRDIVVEGGGVELPTLTDPASADEVLLGKEIIDEAGEKVTGTMPNHAGNSINLSPNYLSYTIPKGYHPGTGRVSVGVEQKTVIPSDTGQIITPTGIKFLRSVTVEPIPEGYMVEPEIAEQDTLLAELATVLQGKAGGAGGGDPDLPSGYMRCDYIRFSGEQTIDTGIVCNQNTKIRVLFTRDSDTSMYMYGVVNSGNTASVTAYLTSSGGSWRFGNKYSTKVIVTNEDLVQTAIVTKTGFVRADDTVAISGVNDFETIGTLILGAVRNADGSVAASQFIGKILLFEMWQGDTEVLHLSPIVSTSGVYRFYDEVSQTFFDSTTDVPLEGGNL